MIALALAATQHRQATYRGICQFIEHAFDGMLGDGCVSAPGGPPQQRAPLHRTARVPRAHAPAPQPRQP